MTGWIQQILLSYVNLYASNCLVLFAFHTFFLILQNYNFLVKTFMILDETKTSVREWRVDVGVRLIRKIKMFSLIFP